jgi:hypothetical protein
MRVHEAKAAKASGAAAQTPDVGKLEMRRVSQDDLADDAVAGEKDADLSSEISGESGKVFGQFRGNNLLRQNASPEGALQRASLGLLNS